MHFAELVPAAVGIALNPVAVVAVILLLASDRPLARAGAFLAGWVAGLLVVGGIVLLAGDAALTLFSPTAAAYVAELAVGLLLLWLAWRKWSKDRDRSADAELPEWMGRLSGFSATKAFVTAALFSGLNPKTLALNFAGVVIIVEAGAPAAAQAVALVGFVAVASLTVGLPVAYYAFAPGHATPALAGVQRWLIEHNAAIVATVLVVLGVMLVSAGVQGLVAGV